MLLALIGAISINTELHASLHSKSHADTISVDQTAANALPTPGPIAAVPTEQVQKLIDFKKVVRYEGKPNSKSYTSSLASIINWKRPRWEEHLPDQSLVNSTLTFLISHSEETSSTQNNKGPTFLQCVLEAYNIKRDKDAVLDLSKRVLPKETSDTLFTEFHNYIRVIRAGNQLLGYFMYNPEADNQQANLIHLAIDPKFQGKGLGTILLHEAERIIRAYNHDRMQVTCTKDLEKFYKKNGYTTGNKSPDYLYLYKKLNSATT
jgi:ribosomal protein S18 acetylase RimI-like enzyme